MIAAPGAGVGAAAVHRPPPVEAGLARPEGAGNLAAAVKLRVEVAAVPRPQHGLLAHADRQLVPVHHLHM